MWIVGREFDRSLEGEGRVGLKREYLRGVNPTLGHVSLTGSVDEARRFEAGVRRSRPSGLRGHALAVVCGPSSCPPRRPGLTLILGLQRSRVVRGRPGSRYERSGQSPQSSPRRPPAEGEWPAASGDLFGEVS